MNAFACQRVQVNRQCCHERFSFTCGHFGNLALMQHNTADKLYIVVHHVPGNHIAAGHPLIAIAHFIAFDDHIIAASSQIAVEIGSGGLNPLIVLEAGRNCLNDGKSLWQNLIEDVFGFFVLLLFQLIDLVVYPLLFRIFHIWIFVKLPAELLNACRFGCNVFAYAVFKLLSLCP